MVLYLVYLLMLHTIWMVFKTEFSDNYLHDTVILLVFSIAQFSKPGKENSQIFSKKSTKILNRRLDKQIVVCPYTGILFRN